MKNLTVSFLLIYSLTVCGSRDPLAADTLPDHVIFTTAQTVSSGLGGLAAMDARCQAKAEAAGLDGTWMAILSDSSADAIDRLEAAGADGPFFNTYPQGPQPVAANLAELFDGALGATLFWNEFGEAMVSDSATWTATLANGTYSGSSYDDWKSWSGRSRVGRQLSNDSQWLDWFEQQGVHSHNLYCVRTDRSPALAPASAPPYVHTIFVSSALFDGDFGGLFGADAECQGLADAAGMDDRLWKAILSDSSVAARDRIRVHGPVFDVRGDFVAADFEDLFDGGNAAFVRFDEDGRLRNGQPAWTGSQPDGSRYSAAGPGAYKQDWTSSQGAVMVGGTLKMGAGWLRWYRSFANGGFAPARLYCIDGQEPTCDLEDPDACGGDGTCTESRDGRGFCRCRPGFAGARCEVDLRSTSKQINAPPSDFFSNGIHQGPVVMFTPEERGQSSTAQTFEVRLSDGGNPGAPCEFNASVFVDRATAVEAGLFAGVFEAGWTLEISDPSGAVVAPDEVASFGTEETIDMATYSLEASTAGAWEFRIASGAQESCSEVRTDLGMLVVGLDDSDRGLTSYVDQIVTITNRDLRIQAYFFDKDHPANLDSPVGLPVARVPEAVSGEMTLIHHPSVAALQAPALKSAVQMQNDGDGLFGVDINVQEEGKYTAKIEMVGERDGHLYTRTDTLPLIIVKPRIVLSEVLPFVVNDVAVRVTDERLPLRFLIDPGQIDLDDPEEIQDAMDRQYLISAEIWGHLVGDDEELPIAWVSTLAMPETIVIEPPDPEPIEVLRQAGMGDKEIVFNWLTVELDGGWISKFLANGQRLSPVGLKAREVRIKDARTRVPISFKKEIPILFDTPGNNWFVNLPAVDPGITPRMLEGLSPQFVSALRSAYAAIDLVDNGDLALVHGWCGTKKTWSLEAFDRTDSTERLAAFHDCRGATEYTIDEFADKLQWYFDCTQTPRADACSCLNLPREGYDLTGVVAHSQGGLATLELATRRWSTFDAVGGLMEQQDPDQRLVQTLGTPWLGSEAGVIADGFVSGLAALVDPFGVFGVAENLAEGIADCDLDHQGLGSTLTPGYVLPWLEELPGRPRERTWFKATEHPRSGTKKKCGSLSYGAGKGSDGRDDGIVGVFSARGLSGGHDLGTKEGLCHNNCMKHPNQRKDKEIVDDFCEHTVLGLFDPGRTRFCDTAVAQASCD